MAVKKQMVANESDSTLTAFAKNYYNNLIELEKQGNYFPDDFLKRNYTV